MRAELDFLFSFSLLWRRKRRSFRCLTLLRGKKETKSVGFSSINKKERKRSQGGTKSNGEFWALFCSFSRKETKSGFVFLYFLAVSEKKVKVS